MAITAIDGQCIQIWWQGDLLGDFHQSHHSKNRHPCASGLATAVDCILPERRLRLVQFDSLNDPFELASAALVGRNERKAFSVIRD